MAISIREELSEQGIDEGERDVLVSEGLIYSCDACCAEGEGVYHISPEATWAGVDAVLKAAKA